MGAGFLRPGKRFPVPASAEDGMAMTAAGERGKENVMPILEFTCDLNAPLERVWAFHNSVETLFKLTPPARRARLLDPPEPMRAGVIYRIQVRQFGIIPVTMHSLIREYTPPTGFVDIQLPGKGPFKSWEHQHRFTALTPACTRLTDHITYEVPLGTLGAIANRLFVRRDLEAMFAYRHAVTRRELEGAAGTGQS